MNVEFFSRCNNDTLFQMAQELCPYPITKVTGFNGAYDASQYLYHILDSAKEWAVNIDIDCFLIHPSSIDAMLMLMEQKGFTHSGVPDGGSIQLRPCAWCVTQPFFNIFNAKQIRTIKQTAGLSWEKIEEFPYNPVWNSRIPRMVTGNFDTNRYEPFNGLFFFLFEHGKPLFLDSMVMGDGISTAVIWGNRTIAYHSWYSREFDESESGRIRILSLHNKAKIDSLINREIDSLPPKPRAALKFMAADISGDR